MKHETTKKRLQELANINPINKASKDSLTIRENAQFSFTFDYNTDDDDIAYIQSMLNKAGADAYAKADDAPEQILVRAFDAQGLAKAKAAIQRGGFQIQENKRLQELASTKPIKEDYSTMSLKSNINQKWQTADDMAGDMQQWLSSVYGSGGEQMYQQVMGILQNLADNFDPEDEM